MVPGSSYESIEFLHRHPPALRPALETEFGKLDTFDTAREIPWKGFVQDDVTQEKFPLNFEGIVISFLVGNFGPALEEIDRLGNVGVPGRARSVAVVLDPDIAEAADGGTFFTIHLNSEEVVTAHAGDPRGIEVGYNTAFEFEGGICGVIGRAAIGFALLVDALGDVRRAVATQSLGFAEEVLEDILPVAEHVHDDAAVVLLPVVPTWTLRRDGVALKDPVAELPANTKNFPEKSILDESIEFHEAREPEFVLDDAVFHTGFLAEFVKLQGGLGIHRDGLFTVDVLSGGDGLAHAIGAAAGRLGIEIDRVFGIRELGVEVGCPAHAFVHGGELRELGFAAADEDGFRPDDFRVVDFDAALLPDREDRADVVLVGAHASGDAVHDDADFMFFHNWNGGDFIRV